MSESTVGFWLSICGGEEKAREIWASTTIGRQVPYEQWILALAEGDERERADAVHDGNQGLDEWVERRGK